MNAVLKRENDWKELPVDLLALGFYYIQNFENYEILRGRSGLGNYHLKKEFSRAFISPSDVIFPKRIVSPDEVIEYLKNDKPLFQSNSGSFPLFPLFINLVRKVGIGGRHPNSFQSDTDPLGNLNSQEIIKQTNSDENTSTNQVKLENNEVIVNQQPVIQYPTDSSQQSLARFIVDNHLITLVPQQGAFIVNGRKGKYCVTLFPKETCQCESSSTCFHILAAKMSIGLQSTQTNNVVSLRALSKNSKKKIDKKSGRKQPRANDYGIEFEPAPDSQFSINTPLKQKLMTTPSTNGSIKPNKTPKISTEFSTPKSKKKLELSVIEEDAGETHIIDEKKNSTEINKSLPVKKRKIDDINLDEMETPTKKTKTLSDLPWIGYCSQQHKQNILNNKYLCSDIIISTQNLLKFEFPEINGFQETTLAPVKVNG
ncbi:unnamed protein product [Mytilus edulis]|uniref:SWIM-type domain-containing protein n=1 Tax=Mytilus edulis TaxID=6550 RepID=A0A8S3VKF6_MYTED|nr:unnamed protein product [Mytilus edulis]